MNSRVTSAVDNWKIVTDLVGGVGGEEGDEMRVDRHDRPTLRVTSLLAFVSLFIGEEIIVPCRAWRTIYHSAVVS